MYQNKGVLRSPTNRANLLHLYISNCDKYIYRDELDEISFHNLDFALKNYGLKHNIEFIKLDKFRWKIKRK